MPTMVNSCSELSLRLLIKALLPLRNLTSLEAWLASIDPEKGVPKKKIPLTRHSPFWKKMFLWPSALPFWKAWIRA